LVANGDNRGPICLYDAVFNVLEAAFGRAATDLICFRSNKRWVTAAKLLQRFRTLPVLFRQEESNGIFTCRYVAELVEIQFSHGFANEAKRLAWRDEKLWLQREIIKGPKRDLSFPTWESQYKKWEIDKFMVAQTWYIVCHLREINLYRYRDCVSWRIASRSQATSLGVMHCATTQATRLN
jgi:hypothetical protein